MPNVASLGSPREPPNVPPPALSSDLRLAQLEMLQSIVSDVTSLLRQAASPTRAEQTAAASDEDGEAEESRFTLAEGDGADEREAVVDRVCGTWRRLQRQAKNSAPPRDDAFCHKCESFVAAVNKAALKMCRSAADLRPSALRLLSVAESATRQEDDSLAKRRAARVCSFSSPAARLRLRSTTLTNIACAQRAAGDTDAAAATLYKVAAIEGSAAGGGCVTPETMLSVGALLTQSGQTDDAVRCCTTALRQLKHMRVAAQLPQPASPRACRTPPPPERVDFLLAAAWHNLGVAQRAAELGDRRAAAANGGAKPAMGGVGPAALHRLSALSFANAHHRARHLGSGPGGLLSGALASTEKLLPPLRDTRRLPPRASPPPPAPSLPALHAEAGFLAGVAGPSPVPRDRGAAAARRRQLAASALLADPSARGSHSGKRGAWDASAPIGGSLNGRTPYVPGPTGKRTAARSTVPVAAGRSQ